MLNLDVRYPRRRNHFTQRIKSLLAFVSSKHATNPAISWKTRDHAANLAGFDAAITRSAIRGNNADSLERLQIRMTQALVVLPGNPKYSKIGKILRHVSPYRVSIAFVTFEKKRVALSVQCFRRTEIESPTDRNYARTKR